MFLAISILTLIIAVVLLFYYLILPFILFLISVAIGIVYILKEDLDE